MINLLFNRLSEIAGHYRGKLYVFYDHPDLNTRELWLKDPEGMVARADANWKALSK